MNALVFDLEIAKRILSIDELHTAADLGISCAATVEIHNSKILTPTIWAQPRIDSTDGFENRMSPSCVQILVEDLIESVNKGLKIVTWNGFSFDFRVLADEVHNDDLRHDLIEIALKHHYDPGFQMVCSIGYMCGIDACCRGMGVEGKKKDVHGGDVPKLWATSTEEQWDVLQYVAQDVIATANAVVAIGKQGKMLQWISGSGRRNVLPFESFLTPAECLEIPLPSIPSWMTSVRPREYYCEWIKL